jgi:hypothetical protein
MPKLKDLKLELPNIPTEEEFIDAINELEEPYKEAAIVRARGSNLIKELNEQKASAERIGWLNLWTKTLNALTSAISAYEAGSNNVLKYLSRFTFECDMHVSVITEPLNDILSIGNVSDIKKAKSYPNLQRIDRLRAYTAWGLWSDKYFYKREILYKKHLDQLWSPHPAKEIIKNVFKYEDYKQLLGEIDVETDERKLQEGRKEMERLYREKITRIDKWLEEPELKRWAEKIEEVSKKKRGKVSFFNLFDEEDNMVRHLKKMGMDFGYADYSKNSMSMHGSSMEQVVHFDNDYIELKLEHESYGDESLFLNIVSNSRRIFVILGVLNHFVLKGRK